VLSMRFQDEDQPTTDVPAEGEQAPAQPTEEKPAE